MKKIGAKIYGNKGWIIVSDDGEVLGFVWKPSPDSSSSFRYETFGVYSEVGFGDTLKDCIRSVESAKR
jgi:hypothetical protein